jgi:hypothetical protein
MYIRNADSILFRLPGYGSNQEKLFLLPLFKTCTESCTYACISLNYYT